jgi:protein-S-isoprenylcysteine O-methyltransferase Ste14
VQQDEPFRTIAAILALVLFPLMAYFRLKSRTSERLDRRQEGLFVLLTLRPIGLVTLAALFAYFVNPASIAWAAAPFPLWLRWAGVGEAIAAGMLIVWTMKTLGRNLTDTVVTREHHTLVVNGPYRFVRHPFYVALALWMTAFSFMAANWFLLAGSLAVLSLLVIRTAAEEERLVARFGDGYLEYMRRTGRFLPTLSNRKS